MQQNQVTRSEAIIQIATQLDGPISLDALTERVLSIWTSHAKNPQAGVRQEVRDSQQGKTVIFLDDNTLLPLHLALSAVRLRVPLSRQEINQGLLYVYPAFQFLLPENFSFADVQLVDAADQTIHTELVTRQAEAKGILGAYQYEVNALNLNWWYRKHNLGRHDSLLLTVLDWTAGKFCLQPELARARRRFQADIEDSNRQLADTLMAMLEASRDERLWGRVAIPTAYARLKDKMAYPADHWLEIIERDPRMRWDGYEIRYAESLTFMERLNPDLRPERSSRAKAKLSAQQAQQVYCFKAYHLYRKGLWRRIEVQGEQTLTELDYILRDAFQHDASDHLSGFWQLIRRGNTRRFREVDLGNINPFEEGNAAATQVASIKLQPGDTLKWVYDFGDWHEYRIELEEVGNPEARADYPRVVAQNKPRYRYCRNCQQQGRKTIATHVCIECSDRQQQEVLMCEDCITPEHEDHYLDELVY